jgi:hypothetical protein
VFGSFILAGDEVWSRGRRYFSEWKIAVKSSLGVATAPKEQQ